MPNGWYNFLDQKAQHSILKLQPFNFSSDNLAIKKQCKKFAPSEFSNQTMSNNKLSIFDVAMVCIYLLIKYYNLPAPAQSFFQKGVLFGSVSPNNCLKGSYKP